MSADYAMRLLLRAVLDGGLQRAKASRAVWVWRLWGQPLSPVQAALVEKAMARGYLNVPASSDSRLLVLVTLTGAGARAANLK